MCVFCDIIAGKIPATKHYEDENFIIIDDISHKAKLHYLVIPKDHYASFGEQTEEQAAKLASMLKKLAELKEVLGLKDGYRLMINQGENGGQTVMHLHVHVLGGEKLPVAP